MNKELDMSLKNQILKIRVGSYLYGTNTENSDEDYSGVFIADKEYYLGMNKIEQVDLSIVDKDKNGKNTKDAQDYKIYEIQKFVKLALENNPNIIEQLFVNDDNILFKDAFGEQLLSYKYKFLHKGLKEKFIGYALSQRKKMIIKLDNYETIKEAYNMLENNDSKYLIEHVDFVRKFKQTNSKGDVLIGDIYIPLNVSIKRAKEILQSRLGRVGNRQELVLKYGFDCKFGSHLIRLLREGVELLETGNLIFPLSYKDEILNIKQGKWKINEVIEYSEHLYDQLNVIFKKSSLRSSRNYNEINQLLIEMIEKFLKIKENNNYIDVDNFYKE